jgi:CRISPR system Cascade subunit CasE
MRQPSTTRWHCWEADVFLTRFQINPARRGARKLLASPHAMHAAVLAAFAEPTSGRPGGPRVLWRVDEGANHQVTLYIASPSEPDLTHLVEQVGWPTTQAWQTRPYDRFLVSLAPGQRWAFRLTANPAHSARHPKKPDSAPTQRFGHVTVSQQRHWLLARADRAGIRIPAGALGEPELVMHHRSTIEFKRDGNQVSLTVATFDGLLEVTDADLLRRTLVSGLGPAKAYGCGLMTLASGPTTGIRKRPA